MHILYICFGNKAFYVNNMYLTNTMATMMTMTMTTMTPAAPAPTAVNGMLGEDNSCLRGTENKSKYRITESGALMTD